ncbi:hypothetical protein CVT24_011548 [Panaeolus cyanescens]|uniref:Homeobox domain-containing protein n=1 Tax=Panaeolus cyanescens TaxID=181874 RepID=A0A409WQP2_9AGAR|nr:hypothetical protein CVT24_011548 [Panaeolus cyanescens]
MSSSATSTTDTDSSILSRGEKRSLTPSETSPLPKRQRESPDHPSSWDTDSQQTDKYQHDHQPTTTDGQKVQLPSISTTFEDYRLEGSRRASLPTLHFESRVRHAPYPPTSLRQNYTPSNQSSLSSYTFPSNGEDSNSERPLNSRPKLSADVNFSGVANSYESSPYPNSGLSNGTTPSSSFSSSHFNSPLNSDLRTPGLSPYPDSDNWNNSPSAIVRPSSTPGQLSSPAVKYDDSLRHASFSAPMSQAPQMFPGSGRISGQHDRRSASGIKGEWSFPNSDFVLPSGSPQYSPSLGQAPNISVSSPSRSPSHQGMPSSTSLVDRPQRKRGKLPKETTDYLKSWLHRHSDHPYPSEEEKKQLCHATGLSMSQVSNWMINARRRILAPAHRAASGPTTTAPFPPTGRSASLNGMMDPIGRRASMPAADALHLYHPMTLQSMPNSPNGHHHSSSDYVAGGSSRHMLGLSSSRSNHHLSGLEYGQSRHHMGLYAPGQGTHSSGHTQSSSYMSSDVPLSAPPSLSNNPFSSHNSSSQGMYNNMAPSPRSSTSSHQYFNNENHSGSGSGSGYGTPP